ncbi:MAG: hypothetical protein IIB38_04500, partial [Candidatus Hydrogenedentes bacterium]|nr:hypothetical protein [Candidatus Hydrogenedentota bacterium]
MAIGLGIRSLLIFFEEQALSQLAWSLLAFGAALALIIAFIKWIEISGVKRARPEDLHGILDLLRAGKREEALAKAKSIKGPVGLLLTDAVNNSEESKELLEEVLYERLLQTQPKLERLIPFIAVVAATSPLLGLLV